MAAVKKLTLEELTFEVEGTARVLVKARTLFPLTVLFMTSQGDALVEPEPET
jgi:hypothetical protein